MGTSLAPQMACADAAAAVVSKDNRDGNKTLDIAKVNVAASVRFARLNKDRDTTLYMQELTGVIGEKAFAAANTDHDGTLDAKELHSASGRRLKRLID